MRFIKSLLVLLFFFHNSCAQLKESAFDVMLNNLLDNSVNQIKAQELQNKYNDVILLDAREKKEYEVSHIDGAINVGYEQFKKSSIKDIPKDKEVIVYCSVGYRSEKIGEKLEKMGFKNVKNLRGGIFEWKNKGYPVVDMRGDTTNKVHAFDQNWGLWLNKGDKVYD